MVVHLCMELPRPHQLSTCTPREQPSRSIAALNLRLGPSILLSTFGLD